MAEISKFEYALRTREVVAAITDFGDAWVKLSDACNTFGISKEEFEKKVIMDAAITDFMLKVGERLNMVVEGLMKGDEDNETN